MGKTRWAAMTGLVVLGAWSIINIVTRSGNPGMYYQYRHSSAGFVYPTDAVIEVSALITGAVVVAALVIWRTATPATVCLLLGICGIVVTFGLGVFAMHAPPYFGGGVVAAFFCGCWLVLVSIVSAIGQWYGRRDGRS